MDDLLILNLRILREALDAEEMTAEQRSEAHLAASFLAEKANKKKENKVLKAPLPWNIKTAPNRVRPRECVRNARVALDRAYFQKERAQIPILIEAVDWLRRALEQMVPPETEENV